MGKAFSQLLQLSTTELDALPSLDAIAELVDDAVASLHLTTYTLKALLF